MFGRALRALSLRPLAGGPGAGAPPSAVESRVEALEREVAASGARVEQRFADIEALIRALHQDNDTVAHARHAALDELIRSTHSDSWRFKENLARGIGQVQREIEIDYESTIEALGHVARALREVRERPVGPRPAPKADADAPAVGDVQAVGDAEAVGARPTSS